MQNIPSLSNEDIQSGLKSANESPRRRHPKLLHKQGAEFNEVFNFTMSDSYMQPHLHPGPEKIEEIFVVEGKFAVIYFDDKGSVTDVTLLKKGGVEMIRVPAFKWHTYVMLTPHAVSYETMMGIYDPKTWKEFASWAPLENTPAAEKYLQRLKSEVLERVGSGI